MRSQNGLPKKKFFFFPLSLWVLKLVGGISSFSWLPKSRPLLAPGEAVIWTFQSFPCPNFLPKRGGEGRLEEGECSLSERQLCPAKARLLDRQRDRAQSGGWR